MKKLNYISSLDGLRACAIILVLIWHYIGCLLSDDLLSGYGHPIKTALSWTWSGVDLFFVLSGFLIGRILIVSKGSQTFFKTFYMRRVLRIFPAYYLIILILIVFNLTHQSEKFPWLMNDLQPTYFYIFYLQNIYMSLEGFGGHWLSVTWSLAVEEQFYLILPLIVYFVQPLKLIKYLIFGILIATLFRSISGPLLDSWLGAYVLLPARMDSLLIGVIIAYYHLNGTIDRLFKKEIKALIGALAIIFVLLMALVLFSDAERIGGVFNHFLYAVFYGLLLILVIVSENNILSKFLSLPILGFLSKISYMIYLTHQIFNGILHQAMLNQAPQINNFNDAKVTLIALGATICFSALSYYTMERPIMKIGQKFQY